MGIRALVVDDSVVFRKVVSDALSGIADVEVLGSANNGRVALSRIKQLQPDLVTLDVEMPELNGIEVLEAARKEGLESWFLMLSSQTSRGSEMTVRALQLGAFDFLTKPEGGSPEQHVARLREDLRPLVQALARKRRPAAVRASEEKPAPKPAAAPVRPIERPAAPVRRPKGQPIVLVGVSTGGPAALANVVPGLPRDLAAPIFIVQHMPAMFTGALATSLALRSPLPVCEATDGQTAARGHIYIAPGGKHMKITRGPQSEIVIRTTEDPPENNCRPAVDYLFRSAALNFPGQTVAAILTGMGADGTIGLKYLKRGGCYSIAQDEASCVVFGMPKEAIQAGLVDTVAPLNRIAGLIAKAVSEFRP